MAKKASSKQASASAVVNSSTDSVAKVRRDCAALAKRERSVAEAGLKIALRIRANFNMADNTVYKTVRDAVLEGFKQHLGDKTAKNRAGEVMVVARSEKLPDARSAPQNLQRYAAKCRELNPTQKRATGGKAKQTGKRAKQLSVAQTAKKVEGWLKALKQHQFTAEAAELVRALESTLTVTVEEIAKQEKARKEAAKKAA